MPDLASDASRAPPRPARARPACRRRKKRTATTVTRCRRLRPPAAARGRPRARRGLFRGLSPGPACLFARPGLDDPARLG